MGVKLLDRTTRATRLTHAGRDFLPLATRLVVDLIDGLDRLRDTVRLAVGDVTIATLQSIAFHWLPRALQITRRPFPRVQVLERSGGMVTEAVRQNQADFGVHIQGEPQSDLEEELLMKDPFVLVCDRSHPLATARTLTWSDLRGNDLITMRGASGNRRLVEAQLARAGLETRGRFVVETTPTALALASAGVGAAILLQPECRFKARLSSTQGGRSGLERNSDEADATKRSRHLPVQIGCRSHAFIVGEHSRADRANALGQVSMAEASAASAMGTS